MSGSVGGENSSCYYPSAESLSVKFPLVAVFGTSVALASFLLNAFFFLSLVGRPRLRTNPSMFYLTLVVFVDLFISVSYVSIMTVQVLYDYLPSLRLYEAWMGYFRQLLTVSTMSLVCSTYLIVGWTLERFLTTCYPGALVYSASGRHCQTLKPGALGALRWCAALGALGVAAVVRGSTFLEISIQHHVNCTGFQSFSVDASSLVYDNYWYRTVWMFWVRNLATVILPFALLAYFNLAIVRTLRSQYRSQQYMAALVGMVNVFGAQPAARPSSQDEARRSLGGESPAEALAAREKLALESEAKTTYKDATLTIIGIVNVFILATIMDVVVASWELIDRRGLQRNFAALYETMADVTSLAKVLCGALRLPVALLCNSLIRAELRLGLACLCPAQPPARASAYLDPLDANGAAPTHPLLANGHKLPASPSQSTVIHCLTTVV